MVRTALLPRPARRFESRHNEANPRVTYRGAGMIGSRGPRILQTIALGAGMLLAVGFSPQGVFPSSATELPATPTAVRSSPLVVIAAGSGATPDARSDVAWLVQQMAASGAQRTELATFPLGFVLVERGTLVIFDANGTPITELGSDRATLLPAGERGSFGSANGDLVLYVQMALVPVAAVPATLPRGMLASTPFSTPASATLDLELVRGIVNPTHDVALPAGAMPALLLATGSAVQVETADGGGFDVPSGEMFLLTEPATVRNPGQQPATFVVARSVSVESATTRPADQSDLDPALSDAWNHYGCQLNPGNPSCLTIGIAAGCATDPTGPDCQLDSDGDRCTDIAEVEAGFDPFDAADCVSGAGGQPAINCLFLTEHLACNGDRAGEPAEQECPAERETRQRRNPSTRSGCDGAEQQPLDDCVYAVRDPGCDGFAPDEVDG
jgi:hypothetical protein